MTACGQSMSVLQAVFQSKAGLAVQTLLRHYRLGIEAGLKGRLRQVLAPKNSIGALARLRIGYGVTVLGQWCSNC